MTRSKYSFIVSLLFIAVAYGVMRLLAIESAWLRIVLSATLFVAFFMACVVIARRRPNHNVEESTGQKPQDERNTMVSDSSLQNFNRAFYILVLLSFIVSAALFFTGVCTIRRSSSIFLMLASLIYLGGRLIQYFFCNNRKSVNTN